MDSNQQTLSFQTEVKQLLQLMIHSLYSNKEIFLRELISNASDACDRLRLASLEGQHQQNIPPPLIKVSYDKPARTITVSDNGIGMSREEMIANLGTIARSGTKEFLQKLSSNQANNTQLIGQFGVGFYSSFIVSQKVSVISRKIDQDKATRWESSGEGEFTVTEAKRTEPGTDITLSLREGEDELLSAWKIKSIITKYSDHINLPIQMPKEEWDKEKNEYLIKDEWEVINEAKALWARPKSEITDEQYREFYKHIARDFTEPLAWTHNKVEGRQEYTQLLYLPGKAPFDLWDPRHQHGLKLFVRRVFIMEDAEQLLPRYLRFVKGVVDANDLPLNVSREILQESRDVKAIKEGCTKRVLSLLEDLSENDKDKYARLWTEFGQVLKEGIAEDRSNRSRIAKLLRFSSTHADNPVPDVSLSDYVGRMKNNQEKIYFVAAETFTAAKNSPHIEVFRERGIEVLLLSDRVDDWMLAHLEEFEGKSLASITQGDLDLGPAPTNDNNKEAEPAKIDTDQIKSLSEKIKASLGDKIKEVRSTQRLTHSPACLVADLEGGMNSSMTRVLKAMGQKIPEAPPVLEINPRHAMLLRMQALGDGDKTFDDWARLLFDQALLAEGGRLEDPATFVKQINALLFPH